MERPVICGIVSGSRPDGGAHVQYTATPPQSSSCHFSFQDAGFDHVSSISVEVNYTGTICFLLSVSVLSSVLEDTIFSCLIIVLRCIKGPLSVVHYLILLLLTSYANSVFLSYNYAISICILVLLANCHLFYFISLHLTVRVVWCH